MPISVIILTWIKKLITCIRSDEATLYSDYGRTAVDPLKNPRRERGSARSNRLRSELPSSSETNYDCHFNWYVSTPKDCLEDFLVRTDSWLKDLEDYPCSEKFTVQFSLYIIKAVAKFHSSDNDGSLKEIELAKSYVQKCEIIPELKQGRYEAHLYLFYANAYHIYGGLQKHLEAREMEKKLKEITLDSYQTKAMFLALKSIFYGHVHNRALKLELCKLAVELDPTYWSHQNIYSRALRTIRRHRFNTFLPSDEETYAAQKAFELNPNSSYTLHRMALLYEEILKADLHSSKNKLLEFVGPEKLAERMIWCCRAAVELNPASYCFSVKLAEILDGRFHIYTDAAAANDRFKICLKRWPNSSHVLHKLGKFWQARGNSNEALDCYKKSLASNPRNFPCSADCIRLLCLKGAFEEAILQVEITLNFHKFDKIVAAKCKFMKSFALWILGKEADSLQCLLHAFDMDPEFLTSQLWVYASRSCGENMERKMKLEHLLSAVQEKAVNDPGWMQLKKSALFSIRNYSKATKFTNANYQRMNKMVQQNRRIKASKPRVSLTEKCPW